MNQAANGPNPIFACVLDTAACLDRQVRFSPDGGTVVVGTDRGLHLVDWRQRTKQSSDQIPGIVDQLAVSPDGKFAVVCAGHQAILWDIGRHKKQSSCVVEKGNSFTGVYIPKEGKRISLLVHQGGHLLNWDVENGEHAVLFRLIDSTHLPKSVFGDRAWCLAVHDGKIAVISVRPGFLVYDLAARRETQFVEVGNGAAVNNMSFSPDGKMLAVAQGPQVLFYDTKTWTQRAAGAIGRSGELAEGLAFSPDGKTLFAATVSGNVLPAGVTLFDPASGENVGYFQTHPERSSSIAVSLDGQHLATAAKDGLKIWKVENIRAAIKERKR